MAGDIRILYRIPGRGIRWEAEMTREVYRGIKKMSKEALEHYLYGVWLDGAISGLREAEHEYDDAIVLTEDEAVQRLSREGYERLIGNE